MQRNLGANAGLDYRELEDFLSAIIAREESVLAALLQAAPAKTGSAEEAPALTSLLNLVFDGPGCHGNGQSPRTCQGCKWQSSHIPAFHDGAGGQRGCDCAVSGSADTESRQHLDCASRPPTDCLVAMAHEVVEEPRRAAVLQCLLNLRRAQMALRELEKDSQ